MERAKLHRLTDILAITFLGVICGADEWTEIELFGQSKLDWLRTFLELPHGIPSHDTFGRVFSRLDPDRLEQRSQKWMQGLARRRGGELIALDGKTLRRSFDQAGHKAAIHMVSAWSRANTVFLSRGSRWGSRPGRDPPHLDHRVDRLAPAA